MVNNMLLRARHLRLLTSLPTLAHTSRSASGTASAEHLAQSLRRGLQAQPQATAAAVAAGLDAAERHTLLSALALRQGQTTTADESSNRLSADACQPAQSGRSAQVSAGRQARRLEVLASLQAERAAAAGADAAEQKGAQQPPNTRMLVTVALAAGLPFVAFGFTDNFIMLIAGDEIDSTFCRRMGFSTLAAAGLGNLVSDVLGLGLADQLEALVRRLQMFKSAPLSQAQSVMAITRAVRTGSSMLGVSVGCLLGMVPLLWFNSDDRGPLKEVAAAE